MRVDRAVAPSASPAAPGVFKASPGALDQQDKAVHGSTLKPSLVVPSSETDFSGVTVTSGSHTTTASGCPTPPPTTDDVKLTLMCDAGAVDRMGFWNYLTIDPNGGSNANYGKDRHLVMQLNRFVDSAVVSKITLELPAAGKAWHTLGYPERQTLGVYAADDATIAIKTGAGQTMGIGGAKTFHLYVDVEDAANPPLKAGDAVRITLHTNYGDSIFDNLKL